MILFFFLLLLFFVRGGFSRALSPDIHFLPPSLHPLLPLSSVSQASMQSPLSRNRKRSTHSSAFRRSPLPSKIIIINCFVAIPSPSCRFFSHSRLYFARISYLFSPCCGSSKQPRRWDGGRRGGRRTRREGGRGGRQEGGRGRSNEWERKKNVERSTTPKWHGKHDKETSRPRKEERMETEGFSSALFFFSLVSCLRLPQSYYRRDAERVSGDFEKIHVQPVPLFCIYFLCVCVCVLHCCLTRRGREKRKKGDRERRNNQTQKKKRE